MTTAIVLAIWTTLSVVSAGMFGRFAAMNDYGSEGEE